MEEIEIKKARYFFVATVGIAPNNNIMINNFSITTVEKYPSMRQLIASSDEKFPNLRNTMVVSITEMSEEDFNSFASE